MKKTMATITHHEAEQIDEANASGLQPVVFTHGLWLLPSSWDRWRAVFEEAGYATLAPSWPDDPNTVEEANAHPETFAHKSVGQIADHFDGVICKLTKKPAIIGHSFGGLLAQILAGRGLAAATVAIDPAPFRGVLPLPISALKSASPVIGNPLNHGRAVPLTYEQFRFGFANAVSEEEAKELYDTFAVPGSGVPLFQAATSNLNPWTEAKVNTKNPDRGPLLIINGERDNTVPWAIANASYKRQKRNEGVSEIVEMPNRGHALVIDSGWRQVADTALGFVKRFLKPLAGRPTGRSSVQPLRASGVSGAGASRRRDLNTTGSA
jgi:non-heme chloroperoxidase